MCVCVCMCVYACVYLYTYAAAITVVSYVCIHAAHNAIIIKTILILALSHYITPIM